MCIFIFKLQYSCCYREDASLVNKQIPSLTLLLSMDTSAKGNISAEMLLLLHSGSFLRNLLHVAC